MKNENLRSAIVLCGGESRRMGQDKGSMIINKKPMILHILQTLNTQIDEVILVLNDIERIANYQKIIQNYFNNNVLVEFSYDLIFLEDEIKGHGPLSGIMTGLENVSSNYALVLPCDSPFVDINFVNFMFDRLNKTLASNFHNINVNNNINNSYNSNNNNNNNNLKNNHIDDLNVIDAIVPYHYKNKESNQNSTFKYSNNSNNSFFLNNENEIIKNFLLNNCEPLHSIYKKNNYKKIRKLLNSNIYDVKSLLTNINSYFLLIDNENSFKNLNTKEDI